MTGYGVSSCLTAAHCRWCRNQAEQGQGGDGKYVLSLFFFFFFFLPGCGVSAGTARTLDWSFVCCCQLPVLVLLLLSTLTHLEYICVLYKRRRAK